MHQISGYNIIVCSICIFLFKTTPPPTRPPQNWLEVFAINIFFLALYVGRVAQSV